MEYGDAIVWLTAIALGASVLVIIGLMLFLAFKAMQQPPS
jgi:ABC-type phosphate transport system auxiliary subunit